jgi:hypothetical protein
LQITYVFRHIDIMRPSGKLPTMLFRIPVLTSNGVAMSDKQSGGGDSQTIDAATCRAKRLGTSNLVECQAAMPSCHWHVPFGEGRLCGHISNQVIAMGVLPMGWSQNAPEIS